MKSQKSKVKSQNHNSKFKINKFHSLVGEDKSQQLITVDKYGNKTGTATRELCHRGNGIPHLAFMAFVIDGNNNIILTKRSAKKSLWAHFWDASVVSHVLPGETVENAVNRRGKEELGNDIPFRKIGAFYYNAKHNDSSENEYCHVLFGTTKEEAYPNPIEIAAIKKISLSDLLEEIKNKREQFAPWLLIALEKIDLTPYL